MVPKATYAEKNQVRWLSIHVALDICSLSLTCLHVYMKPVEFQDMCSI